MKKKIWLSSPHMSGYEKEFIETAFDENWIAPLGPNVNNFEKDLQNYLSVKHVAALSSGTAAIHLALILLGVQQNDEVIVSSFTFSASVNPIIYQKAIPVFIDSEKDTWNMNPKLLEHAIVDRIKKGKKPKAIILVHLYGMPAKMEKILHIADKYEIPIIEDAAEALGSTYNDRKLGSFGKFGILSFNGNKIITTSGGGALTSNNKNAIEKSRFLATQARDNAPHYQHSEIGYNYRMSNILAGIGRGQMKVVETRVQQRRNNFELYFESLKNNKEISFQNEISGGYSNRWLTTILINPNAKYSNTDIRLSLEKDNIETRPLWKPMHLQPVFSKYPTYLNGVSENLFKQGLCLPSSSNLTKEEKEHIISKILRIINK